MVVVMDCTRDVAAVEAFMRYSVRFGLICVLLYILVLSFCAILPFSPLWKIWRTKSGLSPMPGMS